MSTNHDAVAALPISGSVDKTLVRNVFTKRMPYVLADVDDVTNLVAVDPATGAAIIDFLFLGRVFHYDATDTTTANDGTSCLVSFEGRRYKLASSSDVFAFAVLDNTHSAPPVSPAIGDAYLIAAAATGAWVGKSNFVTVFTRRGWEFINFGIGRMIYVEAVDSYYHKNAGGSWVVGMGGQLFAASSIPLSAAINFGKRLIVENQTTTAPPGAPSLGTAYIIGAGATGAWAGLDAKIAICEVAGSFTIYTPTAGWTAFDKALGVDFRFITSWISAAGSAIGFTRSFAASPGFTNGGSTYYNFNPGTAPTTNQIRGQLSIGLTVTPKSGASFLKLRLSAVPTWTSSSVGDIFSGDFPPVIALFRDSEVNAVAWAPLCPPRSTSVSIDKEFIVASDGIGHLWRWAIMFGGDNSTTPADKDVSVSTMSNVDQSCMELLS